MNYFQVKLKRAGLVLCLFVCFSSSINAGNYDLLFKSGRVATTENVEQFIRDPGLTQDDLFANNYFRIVQFHAIPTAEQRLALTAAGIRLTNYFPNYAYMVIFNHDARLEVLLQTGARSVLKFDARWKLNEQLKGTVMPEHAMSGKKHIDLVIRYYKSLEAEQVAAALTSKGYTIIRRYDYGNWMELRCPVTAINQVAELPFVSGVEPIAPEPTKDDERGRSLHRSNVINTLAPMGRHYDGTGVSAALADDGPVGPHIDYTGRIDQTNATANSGSHGDMTTGILMGGGNLNPTMRGMGTGAFIYIYDISGYNHILNSPILNQTQGVLVTSTSYSQGCNEYTTDTQTGDQILNENPTLLHVYSAGNNGGGDCTYGAGPGWGNITGGYKQGKNVISCGNLNYLDVLEGSSSRGPAADGRIKPDICANGINQMSTDGPNTYQVGGGTSAACPGIAGIVTQLHQAYRDLNGGVTGEGALIKACMLNSAEDLGNPGPDYRFGWGRVNAFRAVTTLEDVRFINDSVSQGATNNYTITVPANTKQFRVMVYWNDVEGDPVAAKALVNDLNMIVTDPSATTFEPWVLNPAPNAATLNANAVRGIDDLNNMEQVTIDDPAAGTYDIDINGFLVPQGPQHYYIVYEFRDENIDITYPIGYEGFVPGDTETIRWDAFGNTGAFNLEYSTDLGVTWNTINANVGAAIRAFNWIVPNTVTGEALVRITRGVVSTQSPDAFSIIGLPQNIAVDWACPDSIRLEWTAATGATGYEISMLGAMYMDSIAFSTTNSVILTGINPMVENWFSVRAYTGPGSKGRRAIAIYKAPGVFNCPIAIDASITELVSPSLSLQNCHDLSSMTITIDVENIGMSPITNIPVNYSINNGPVVTETIMTTLNSFAATTYTFTVPYDFSVIGVYDVKVWTDYLADGNQYNDTITQVVDVISGVLQTLPYSEDFETFINCATANDCEQTQCGLSNGWINLTNLEEDEIDWRTSEGSTPSTDTGPDVDHDPGTATGNYLYLEASACFQRLAVGISPCFDLTAVTSTEMTFWYHMYGADMGVLHVDVFANDVWTNDVIAAISGNQGNQWLQATVNLAPFSGNIINIRFRANTGPDYTSDIAIDDIEVYEINAPPVTNFTASATNICVNETITLTDLSQNSPTNWVWTINPASGYSFVNGTTATSQHPELIFTQTGVYDVGLTSSNGFGSSNVTFTSYITVGTGAVTPLVETFQSAAFPPVNWLVENFDNLATWNAAGPLTGSSGTATTTAFMNNFTYNAATQEDGLITERIDLNGAVSPIVTFDVSHARYSATFEDALRVDISTDCGVTYIPTGYFKQGLDLSTVPDQTNLFTPATAQQWRNDTIDLAGYIGSEVKLKFVNITGYGNSLYLDNINFHEDPLGLIENVNNEISYSVFPNPGSGLFNLNVAAVKNATVDILVRDVKGSLVMERNAALTTGLNSYTLDLTSKDKGIYFMEIKLDNSSRTVKLVVM